MKREQLKKLIKPIIKECIHEVIIESGVLSNIVAEVSKGMGNVIVETKQPEVPSEPERNVNQEAIEIQKRRLDEQRKKLTSAIGNDAYSNIFEGIEPIHATSDSPSSQAAALSGVNPSDPGVYISGIVALCGKHWKTLAHSKKR